MNPEFVRNLWLEGRPFRLSLIAGLLLLVFSVTTLAPGLFSTGGVALALYWFFMVLWGTRNAALSVVAEIRDRTWESQKLCALGAADMVWGKLFGATIHCWFGGVICLPFIVLPMATQQGAGPAAVYAVILLALGVFAQAVALLSSLTLIRRQAGNWRLDTFLCQVAGIAAAFAYYTLWNSADAFVRTSSGVIVWWGHAFNLGSFHLVSLLLFCAWALVGCWRAMRAELRFANGPFVWLGYLAYMGFYEAGFWPLISRAGSGLFVDIDPAIAGLTLATCGWLTSTYAMAFLEPKDPVRLRWLGDQVRARRFVKAFLALDAWMLSLGVTLAAGFALALLMLANRGMIMGLPLRALSPAVLAMLGLLVRDVSMFVLMRSIAGAKGDFAALTALGTLYFLLPMILHVVGLGWMGFAFLPMPGGHLGLSVLAGWAQGLGVALWAARSTRAKFNAA